MHLRTALIGVLWLLSPLIQAQECDCTQITGTCLANIEVTPTGNAKGRYGADLLLRADAAACAKVDYYVGSMPAMTILNNGTVGNDRVMGTADKPVRSRDITVDACHVCKTAEQAAADRSREEAERAAAELRAQQAEVDRMVSEGTRSGNLYSGTSQSRDAFSNSVMQLQKQLPGPTPVRTTQKVTAPSQKVTVPTAAGSDCGSPKNAPGSYYYGCR